MHGCYVVDIGCVLHSYHVNGSLTVVHTMLHSNHSGVEPIVLLQLQKQWVYYTQLCVLHSSHGGGEPIVLV